MPRLIRAILFDLGGTLMEPLAPWAPVLAEADRALHQRLEAASIELDVGRFRQRLREYHERRDKELHETTYHMVLREVMEQTGHGQVPESVSRLALNAMFTVTQDNWTLRADATAALQDLQESGYRLAIVSNAGDDQDVQDLVKRFGIRSLLDFVLTSAACSYRKPHPRIFELALARWMIESHEAAMVGDTLEADVLGAKRAGLYSIWLTSAGDDGGATEAGLEPDAILGSLSDIGQHLRTLQR